MKDNIEFIEILKNKILSFQMFTELDEEILQEGLEKFRLEFFPSDTFLITAGLPCKRIFFTQSSIVRCFHIDEEGEEKTDWIEPEQNFVTDFFTFFSGNAPSGVNISMYEDSYVLSINKEDYFQLLEKHHQWALLGTKILSASIEYSTKIADILVKSNAEERYRYIEEHYPRFLQVVPLHHIASRLNLSPVTISRIRAKKRE